MIWDGPDVKVREINQTINVVLLNHAEATPPISARGKVVFRKASPWCENGWGPLFPAVVSASNAGAWSPQGRICKGRWMEGLREREQAGTHSMSRSPPGGPGTRGGSHRLWLQWNVLRKPEPGEVNTVPRGQRSCWPQERRADVHQLLPRVNGNVQKPQGAPASCLPSRAGSSHPRGPPHWETWLWGTQFALGMLTHYKATTLRWEKGIFFLTPLTVHQASPISRLQTNTSYQIGSSIRLEIKCSVCVMSLNHPETNPCPLVCETNCLPRNIPGAKKGWGPPVHVSYLLV